MQGNGEEKTILFGLTGTGYFDMVAYEKYNNGQMTDYVPTDADLQAGFDQIPKFREMKSEPNKNRQRKRQTNGQTARPTDVQRPGCLFYAPFVLQRIQA